MEPRSPAGSRPAASDATRGAPRDGEATRALLVETAERLFAEQGIGPVSVRAINREAGQAAAAVHYHFGSKQAILDAVLRRLGDPVHRKILTGGTKLLAHRKPLTAGEVIEAWARPIVECLDADPVRAPRWLRLTTRLSGREIARLWPDPEHVWAAVMSRAFPDVTEKTRRLGWTMVAQSLPHLLARAPSGTTADGQVRREAYMSTAIEFVAAGLDRLMRSASKAGQAVDQTRSDDEGFPASLGRAAPAVRRARSRP